jgi:phosphopantetheinyl transferase
MGQAGSVELFVARVEGEERDQWLAGASHWLTRDEWARATEMPDRHTACLHVIGQALTRVVAAAWRGADPANIRIGHGPEGKPFLVDYPDVWTNVAHTGNVVVLAVSQTASVGVDIERASDAPRTLLRLASRRFAATEAAYLAGLPTARQAEQFLRFWVLKEAVAKSLGGSVFNALAGVVLEPGGGTEPQLSSVWAGPAADQWTIHQFAAPGGVERVAIAIEAPQVELGAIRIVSREALTKGDLPDSVGPLARSQSSRGRI